MKSKKIFYIFGDPFGTNESKVGITGNYKVRLGVYQNSFSSKSHVACFDIAYIGAPRAINNLEKAVKQELNFDIELDGRGHSEWVSLNYKIVEKKIDEIIQGYQFKVYKVPKKYLPVTVDNAAFYQFITSTESKND